MALMILLAACGVEPIDQSPLNTYPDEAAPSTIVRPTTTTTIPARTERGSDAGKGPINLGIISL